MPVKLSSSVQGTQVGVTERTARISGFLAARQDLAPLADLREIAVLQDLQVRQESGGLRVNPGSLLVRVELTCTTLLYLFTCIGRPNKMLSRMLLLCSHVVFVRELSRCKLHRP